MLDTGRNTIRGNAPRHDTTRTRMQPGFATFFALIAAIVLCSAVSSSALPSPQPPVRRDYPVFPAQPPSCPLCAQNYANIDSCAQAAPVLANVSMVRPHAPPRFGRLRRG